MNKKIQVHYKSDKGRVIYLFSTNSYKTCKDAKASVKDMKNKYPQSFLPIKKMVERETKEKFNPNNIIARFD